MNGSLAARPDSITEAADAAARTGRDFDLACEFCSAFKDADGRLGLLVPGLAKRSRWGQHLDKSPLPIAAGQETPGIETGGYDQPVAIKLSSKADVAFWGQAGVTLQLFQGVKSPRA